MTQKLSLHEGIKIFLPSCLRVFVAAIRTAKTLWIFIFISMQNNSLIAQQKYPALTHVISFDDLVERKTIKMVEWINPDGVREKMKIVEMAIPIDQKMRALTTDFVRSNYGLDSPWLHPRVIVFHAMGDGDLRTSLEVSSFLNDRIPEEWGNLCKAGNLPNGAHFIIEKKGDVICLSPPVSSDESRISYDRDNHKWWVKRHQDGNPIAIGIENVTDRGNVTDLTTEQIESNAKLARWLLWMESGKIDYIMSHHQFNDDHNYALFLTAFKLKHVQKQYRTKGRKDIGDRNLRRIIDRIDQFGCETHSFFDIP
jgi:hypothetical protein